MAAKDSSKSDMPSGLGPKVAEQMLAGLMTNRQIVDCQQAAAKKARAEIGVFVRSTRQFFYDKRGKPVVRGLEPGLILKGDWTQTAILTAADAAENQTSPSGFVAACSIDLAAVRDIAKFLLTVIEQFGPVTVAPQFQPDLVRSVPYIGADADTLAKPPVGVAYDGTGVTVCVVDMGCDFAHRNFRMAKMGEPTGTLTGSRLKLLIDMKAGGGSDDYTQAMIDGWLASPSPYEASPYKPHAPKNNCTDPDLSGSHGTLVMDIAAGNGNGTGIKGVAPAADLCFVQVYVEEVDGRKFVSGAAIFNAIKRAVALLQLDTAAGKPTVFNVSLGTNDGPHDSFDHGDVPPSAGQKAWNVKLDNQCFNTKKGRALVWSAGNQFRGGLHASGFTKRETDGGGVPTVYTATFDVRVPQGDQRSNEVKIWFDKPAGVDVTMTAFLADCRKAPATVPTAAVTATSALTDEAVDPAGTIEAATKYGSLGGSTLHFLRAVLTPRPLKKRWETWRLQVTGRKVVAGADVDFPAIRLDAWIERDDADQAAFRRPPPKIVAVPNTRIDPLGTLSGNAAGVANAIVVGAISTATYAPPSGPRTGNGIGEIMAFSSAGPTRDSTNNRRPDVCAPGELINGAKSKGDPIANGTGYGKAVITAMSGTSMAAPHVAGLVALLFDKKRRGAGSVYPGSYPTSIEARDALTASARPNIESVTPQWDPQRGFGCVDAVKLLT